jgi:hypothetical protein
MDPYQLPMQTILRFSGDRSSGAALILKDITKIVGEGDIFGKYRGRAARASMFAIDLSCSSGMIAQSCSRFLNETDQA